MADLIEPHTLKGFRDYPPKLMIPRERMLEQARRVYRSYGFAPIDTPALEYTEILLGKGRHAEATPAHSTASRTTAIAMSRCASI